MEIDRALLDAWGITDSTSYKAWCLQHHPDKVPPNKKEEATRMFARISAAYNNIHSKKDATPSAAAASSAGPSRPAKVNIAAFIGKNTCGAYVKGTTGNICHLRKLSGHNACFYHDKPENIRFLDPDEVPSIKFDMFASMRPNNDRTYSMCEMRMPNGKFCRRRKKIGNAFCNSHVGKSWSPKIVLRMETGTSKAPVYVGFVCKSDLNKEQDADFVHIRAKLGAIKDFSESKEKATHIYSRAKLVSIEDFM